MAETKKNGTMKAMIDGALSDVMVKTNVENVVYSTGGDGSEVMLSTKMAEILGSARGPVSLCAVSSCVAPSHID